MKLIIIDDQPIQHFIMRRMIEVYLTAAPQTEYYVDATKVLDLLTQNKNNADELPDIIFVDVNMPIMGGAAFLSKFDKLKHTLIKPIAIYIVSSSIDPVDIALAKQYSFVLDYIIKPITKDILKNIFERPN